MTHKHKHKNQDFLKKNLIENNRNKKTLNNRERLSKEIKDAHAAGIGALGRSEENPIEKTDNKFEGNDAVY